MKIKKEFQSARVQQDIPYRGVRKLFLFIVWLSKEVQQDIPGSVAGGRFEVAG
ncbi:MAG: hypothetical protein ACM3SY_21360 [Candidatus Omnitrophota bacterium]